MTSRGKKALIALSSGLDSSVALAIAKTEMDVVLALTFDYGQRAAQQEIEKASQLAAHFHVPHRSLILPWFREFKKSALLKTSGLPRPSVEQLSDDRYTQRSASAVWVPNRNGVFIECAAAFADEEDIPYVIVGFNKEEAATFPDNSEDYVNAINHALSFSTRNQVKVISHTAHLNKTEIVKKAKELNFPFSKLWSCYEGKTKMCGRCESCVRLKRALIQNEVPSAKLFEYPELD